MALILETRPVQTFQPRTIWCLGRNYAEHARELGNVVESNPLVFQKGLNALAVFAEEVKLDWSLGPIHYETELVLLMARREGIPTIVGIGLGLDLTLRELQSELKSGGKPWTLAKSFDNSAIISQFIPTAELADLNALRYTMHLNGELRQTGETQKMILPMAQTVEYLETYTALQAGDLIFTGTPAGVGTLHPGDVVEAGLGDQLTVSAKIV
ncbi:MAG: fumarylacetoacetate hydrolase family protein [Candidatus Marinimicrobia bacterium]|nr:fumarylacetoacetate hydrolase family protein [Candidatus Neomarinimicrobiota bacterium]MCF7840950.1 fumarylacetoacetate hydrolase family protein [Candidatus Neomarinimicrobiota bacterium]